MIENLRPDGNFDPLEDFASIPKKFVFEPEIVEQQLLTYALNGTHVITTPIEFLIRPSFGSRFVNPISAWAAWFMMQVLWIICLIADPLLNAILKIPARPIGMGIALLVFYVAGLYHARRIKRYMFDLNLEKFAYDEGQALPFFRWFGKPAWTRVRIVYEPLFVAAVAIAGYFLHLFQPTLAISLIFGAGFLSMKNSGRYYGAWIQKRIERDMRNEAEEQRRINEGQSSPDTTTLQGEVFIVTGAKPVDAEPKTKRPGASGLDPEVAGMVSNPEPPKPRPNGAAATPAN